MWPIFMGRVQLCQGCKATTRKQFTFNQYVPRSSQSSFHRPQTEKMLSRPWSRPVVLNPERLDSEYSALTNGRNLFQKVQVPIKSRRQPRVFTTFKKITQNWNFPPTLTLAFVSVFTFHITREENILVVNFCTLVWSIFSQWQIRV